MRKIIKNSLILAIMAAIAVFAAVSRAEDNKYIDMLHGEIFRTDIEEAEDEIEALSLAYHNTLNDIFNVRIEAITALGENIAVIAPPELMRDETGQITSRAPCAGGGGTQNLSTYCLAMDTSKEYFQFRAALVEARRLASERAGGLKKNDEDILTYGQAINRIDREIEIARQTMDSALSAYNELQLALPMHYKYISVIKALEQYRDKVSDIRRQIEQYPETFIDLTTTACT